MRNFENPILVEKEIRMQRERFKNEIAEYRALVEQLRQVKDLKIETASPKVSLAFLIERIKTKNPEGWQVELENFRKEISDANQKGGKTEVTWLVCERISSSYIDFLTERAAQVKDESLKRKLAIFKKMVESSLEFSRKAHEQGQPVAFGGVSLDYVPKWYYYVEK